MPSQQRTITLSEVLGAQLLAKSEARAFAQAQLGDRPIPEFLERRIRGFPTLPDPETGQPQTTRMGTFGGTLGPTIRMIDGELKQLSSDEAARELRRRGDAIVFDTKDPVAGDKAAEEFYSTLISILESQIQ